MAEQQQIQFWKPGVQFDGLAEFVAIIGQWIDRDDDAAWMVMVRFSDGKPGGAY